MKREILWKNFTSQRQVWQMTLDGISEERFSNLGSWSNFAAHFKDFLQKNDLQVEERQQQQLNAFMK